MHCNLVIKGFINFNKQIHCRYNTSVQQLLSKKTLGTNVFLIPNVLAGGNAARTNFKYLCCCLTPLYDYSQNISLLKAQVQLSSHLKVSILILSIYVDQYCIQITKLTQFQNHYAPHKRKSKDLLSLCAFLFCKFQQF